MQKDPVCGMSVDEKKAGTQSTNYQGHRYYFCGNECKDKFDSQPQNYTKQEATANR